MAAKTETDIDDVEPVADDTASQARRVVAAYAEDADECRVFLSMLGIGPAKLDACCPLEEARAPTPGPPTSSWSPTGCPSTWSAYRTVRRRGSAAPAGWSPHSNRCCASSTARGSAGRASPTVTR